MSGVSARKSSRRICWNCFGSASTRWISKVFTYYLVILVVICSPHLPHLRQTWHRAEELALDLAVASEEMAEEAASV